MDLRDPNLFRKLDEREECADLIINKGILPTSQFHTTYWVDPEIYKTCYDQLSKNNELLQKHVSSEIYPFVVQAWSLVDILEKDKCMTMIDNKFWTNKALENNTVKDLNYHKIIFNAFKNIFVIFKNETDIRIPRYINAIKEIYFGGDDPDVYKLIKMDLRGFQSVATITLMLTAAPLITSQNVTSEKHIETIHKLKNLIKRFDEIDNDKHTFYESICIIIKQCECIARIGYKKYVEDNITDADVAKEKIYKQVLADWIFRMKMFDEYNLTKHPDLIRRVTRLEIFKNEIEYYQACFSFWKLMLESMTFTDKIVEASVLLKKREASKMYREFNKKVKPLLKNK